LQKLHPEIREIFSISLISWLDCPSFTQGIFIEFIMNATMKHVLISPEAASDYTLTNSSLTDNMVTSNLSFRSFQHSITDRSPTVRRLKAT